jgi:hypothetical protein
VSFLHENSDVFAWSHEDIIDISPSMMVHKLNVDPNLKPAQQRRRGYSTKKSKATAEEVKKLCEIGFIKEIQYTM